MQPKASRTISELDLRDAKRSAAAVPPNCKAIGRFHNSKRDFVLSRKVSEFRGKAFARTMKLTIRNNLQEKILSL